MTELRYELRRAAADLARAYGAPPRHYISALPRSGIAIHVRNTTAFHYIRGRYMRQPPQSSPLSFHAAMKAKTKARITHLLPPPPQNVFKDQPSDIAPTGQPRDAAAADKAAMPLLVARRQSIDFTRFALA